MLNEANLVSQAAQVAIIGRTPLVEVFVSTRYLDGMSAGDRVELKVEKQLGDETIGGTVTSVEDNAEARLSSLGIEERKVRVLVSPGRAGHGRCPTWDVRALRSTASRMP
jgi:hypothetical protein